MKNIIYLFALAATVLMVAQPSYGNPDEPSNPKISSSPDGVTINGVTWATRNVGAKRKFMDKPEDYGNYYAFGKAQTVCPQGWRTPTLQEFEVLVAANNGWTTLNGINGRWFGNGEQAIFLPAAGYRYYSYYFSVGIGGFYWSSSPTRAPSSYHLAFYADTVYSNNNTNRGHGLTVRCVRK